MVCLDKWKATELLLVDLIHHPTNNNPHNNNYSALMALRFLDIASLPGVHLHKDPTLRILAPMYQYHNHIHKSLSTSQLIH